MTQNCPRNVYDAGMANTVAPLRLRTGDREVLEGWLRASSTPQSVAKRARIVLLAADGWSNTAIAEEVGVSRPTVIDWRNRYWQEGVETV